MITCDLRGQLGNQMFIAATVIAHAIKMKTSYAFPLRSGKRGQFPFMFDHLPIMQEWNGDIFDSIPYREKQFGVYNPLPEDPNLHLSGYFQSEKYFKEYRQEVIEAFGIPIFPRKVGTVSIHIRRGDSLRFESKLPQPTRKYLMEAMNRFIGYNFMIYSDDIEWCREHFIGYQFGFSLGKDPKHEMGSMAACAHNIIVNSTFSWWSAYLNSNPNKVVIAPHKDNWFGEAYKNRLSAEDIIPEDWIQIKYF